MKNSSLKSLNIGSNDFTETSVFLLSEMLTVNTTLQELDITCNKLGEVQIYQVHNQCTLLININQYINCMFVYLCQ